MKQDLLEARALKNDIQVEAQHKSRVLNIPTRQNLPPGIPNNSFCTLCKIKYILYLCSSFTELYQKCLVQILLLLLQKISQSIIIQFPKVALLKDGLYSKQSKNCCIMYGRCISTYLELVQIYRKYTYLKTQVKGLVQKMKTLKTCIIVFSALYTRK